MKNLIKEPDITYKDCEETELRVKSICTHIIYTVSKDRCKPAKNITLGLDVNSLTNY